MSKNLTKHNFTVSREQREIMGGHKGKVIWFTGLSGSGKSTVANALEDVLHKRGLKTYILDGDNVDLMEVHETIEEQVAQGAKIAAIKYYREVMDTHFDTKVSLKEAKDFVDAIQNDMIRRKII